MQKTAVAAPADEPQPHRNLAAALRQVADVRKSWASALYSALALGLDWSLRRAGGEGTLGK